ncbi:hypothetical protein HQ560_17170, partial [bacterium]|nr:hypothetical protein [bacterium]
AVGVVVNSGEPWQTTETSWLFRYARAKSAYGVQIIHPLKDGQVVIRITRGGVVAATPRAWTEIGYQRGDARRLTFTEDFKALFPLKDNQPAAVASTLRADGSYELQMDGRVVAQGVFMAASPLSFAMKAGARFPGGSSWAKRIFSGRQFPEQWEAGYAGILVEPLDSGQNTVSDLHYSPGITRLKTDENRQF